MMRKREFARRAFKKWIYRLGLCWWEVTVRFYDDPSEIVKRFRQDDDFIVLASSWVDWRYSKAAIDVNLPELMKQTKDEIERAIVHELMHVLVNEMHEGEMHHEERVVTQLTKAIFWTVADIPHEAKR